MVVVTDFAVPRPVVPPPPDGLDIDTVNVSPVPSSTVSSLVCTVKVCDPAALSLKVSVPDLAV